MTQEQRQDTTRTRQQEQDKTTRARHDHESETKQRRARQESRTRQNIKSKTRQGRIGQNRTRKKQGITCKASNVQENHEWCDKEGEKESAPKRKKEPHRFSRDCRQCKIRPLPAGNLRSCQFDHFLPGLYLLTSLASPGIVQYTQNETRL